MNRQQPPTFFQRTLLCALFLILAGHGFVLGQAPVDYDDVALVINENSEVSKEIGAYFALKRSIPEKNIIRITVPTTETISDQEFQDLRSQIEMRLTENDLNGTINYMVLTKGVPIRINRSITDENAQNTTKASVDNELTLAAGTFSNLIGNQGWATHNYVEIVAHFNRSLLPIFLVSRLDAYTKEQIFAMIDNSGPNTLVNKDSALFVLDRDPIPIDPAFDQSQVIAAQILAGRGWRVLLNSDSVYVTGQRNVLGYASWGSNDHFDGLTTQNAIPHNTWSPGALAETFVSTSGRSLQPGTTYGQSLIADWLAEGVVGAKGYVYEPFTIALALPHILFDRYTDETQDTAFNLAESFYMASRTLSWMDLLIGDPKTSIISSIPPVPTPILPPSVSICENDDLTLRPTNVSRGAHYWFAGDSATVAAVGLPYDSKHPLYIAGGKTYRVPTIAVGTKAFTYVNTNVSGDGLTQIAVTVVPIPVPDFDISSDTVDLNEPVVLTDRTEGNGERRWLFGDGTISTDSEHVQTHAYRTEGTFFITLTIINEGCIRSVVKTVVVRSTTGVEEEVRQPNLALDVLPNPTIDEAVVSLEVGRPTEVTLRIYDPSGRLLLEERRHSRALFRQSISLREYPAGLYLIEVTAGERRGTATVVRR